MDVDVGMIGLHTLNALGRGQERQQLDLVRAALLADGRGVRGRTARREHRVDDQHQALAEILRQLLVVRHRLQRLLIPVHAEKANARHGNHRQHAVEHADAGAQDRHDADLLARHATPDRLLDRCLHRHVFKHQVSRRLIGEHAREFAGERTEVAGRSAHSAQERDLVLDERVVADVESHGAMLPIAVTG